MTPAQAKHVAGESLLIEYQWRVEQGLIDYDPAQVEALHYLQEMLDKLTTEDRSGFLRLPSTRGKPCKSLYIYGGVGRGKSMLMDLFYDHCPIQEKRRVHFHTFILEVHELMPKFKMQFSNHGCRYFGSGNREIRRN